MTTICDDVVPSSSRSATGPSRSTDRRPPSVAVSMQGAGMLWFGAWLFTIGFTQLGFWKGVLALILWPYYLGVLAR